MADIARKVRSTNSHEPNNFTLGHFGRPEYDDLTEEWRFLRSGGQPRNGDDVYIPLEGWPALELLHSQLVLSGGATESDHDTPCTGSISNYVHRPLRSLYETRLAIGSTVQEDLAKPPPRYASARPSLVLGYAWSPYEISHHSVPVPIAIAAYPGEHVLKANLLKHAGEGSDAEQLPLMDTEQAVIPAPLREPVLGLSFSADKRYLAIRQLSGTSIVVPILDDVRSSDIGGAGPDVRLEHIVALPKGNTGGFIHVDVEFHPKDHSLLGIVDEHGNWSVWQLKGRKSTTSRVLHTICLRGSGKLLPSPTNSNQLGKDFYFDSWHKICCLAMGQNEANVLLVCSRRIARTYWSNGTVRGDVDMRLGAPSAKNWVLDVQSSLQHPAVCFVLTSTRILVMRLSDDKEKDDELDLLCSWTHFRARGDMSLRLDVVETDSGLFLCSARITDPSVYWLRWTNAGELASAADPQQLPVPGNLPHSPDMNSTYRVEALQVNGTLTRTDQSPARIFAKFLAALPDGSLYDATYSYTSAPVSASDQIHVGHIMRLPQPKEWHFKSAKVVSEEDDLLDFVVADHDLVSWRPGEEKESPLPRMGQQSARTRNWADLLHLEVNVKESVILEDALHRLDSASSGLSHGQNHLQTLSDLLPEIHITDVEETATTMSVWQTALQRKANPSIIARYPVTFDAATGTFAYMYENVSNDHVKAMSNELPERTRVQTERLSRNVAFDKYMSSLTRRTPQGDVDYEDLPEMESLLLSSPQPMASEEDSASPFAVLQRYTSIPRPPAVGIASRTASSILAHLPDSNLTDPDNYSYEEVEERLKGQRTQEELDNLDARARRRAERTVAREEARMARQQRLRNEATQQSTVVPSLVVSSPQRDPRQVQSSQLEAPGVGSSQPGLTMTQPERGAHGERRQAVKKGGKRMKGF